MLKGKLPRVGDGLGLAGEDARELSLSGNWLTRTTEIFEVLAHLLPNPSH